MANPVGRPPKLNEAERLEVYEALEAFITNNEDPTLPEFETSNEVALKYKINDSNLYDWAEFSGLIKRIVRKQESYLLKNGGKGTYNPTMAIFRLKQPQHGYTDRSQVDAKVEQVIPILGGAAQNSNSNTTDDVADSN